MAAEKSKIKNLALRGLGTINFLNSSTGYILKHFLTAVRSNDIVRLRLNDFEEKQKTLPNGQTKKYFECQSPHNGRFQKTKFFVVTLEEDGTRFCPYQSFKLYLSKISEDVKNDLNSSLILKIHDSKSTTISSKGQNFITYIKKKSSKETNIILKDAVLVQSSENFPGRGPL